MQSPNLSSKKRSTDLGWTRAPRHSSTVAINSNWGASRQPYALLLGEIVHGLLGCHDLRHDHKSRTTTCGSIRLRWFAGQENTPTITLVPRPFRSPAPDVNGQSSQDLHYAHGSQAHTCGATRRQAAHGPRLDMVFPMVHSVVDSDPLVGSLGRVAPQCHLESKDKCWTSSTMPQSPAQVLSFLSHKRSRFSQEGPPYVLWVRDQCLFSPLLQESDDCLNLGFHTAFRELVFA